MNWWAQLWCKFEEVDLINWGDRVEEDTSNLNFSSITPLGVSQALSMSSIFRLSCLVGRFLLLGSRRLSRRALSLSLSLHGSAREKLCKLCAPRLSRCVHCRYSKSRTTTKTKTTGAVSSIGASGAARVTFARSTQNSLHDSIQWSVELLDKPLFKRHSYLATSRTQAAFKTKLIQLEANKSPLKQVS